jgi:hypothetical protein
MWTNPSSIALLKLENPNGSGWTRSAQLCSEFLKVFLTLNVGLIEDQAQFQPYLRPSVEQLWQQYAKGNIKYLIKKSYVKNTHFFPHFVSFQ